ncbi:MAG: hybrid sensor histidine kinase/response regulator [Nitrospirota bacterium]
MSELHAMIGYPLFPVAGLELLLGFILLRQNPKHSPVNRSVAILAFFSSAFSLITGLMYVRASLGVEYNIYARANWIGWFTLPPALQFLYYLENEKSRVARIIGLVLYPFWTIMLALSLFTDLIVTGEYALIPFSNRPGPLENPLRFFGACLAVWVIVKVFNLRRRTSGFIKKELSYFFYGVLIFGGGAGFTAGVLQLTGGGLLEPGLASYFSLPWVALTVFAIARYQLFDIRLILSRTIATVLLLVIFSAVQAGMFLLFERALGHGASIFMSLTLVGFLFFGTPFSDRVQALVNSVILKDKYSYQDILRNATRAMATILNLDELLRHIVTTLQESLRVDRAILYLRKSIEGHELVRYFGAEGQTRLDLLSDALVEHLLRTREPVIRLIQESLPEDHADRLAAALRGIGADIVVPIFYQTRLQGVLALGPKGNGAPYTQTDIALLETLAGHAAVSLENATLFQETLRINRSLEESEGKFRALAETIPAAIFIHQGGSLLYANPAGVQLTGFSREELLTMEFWRLVHPEHREMIRTRAAQRLTGGSLPTQYEFKIVARGGDERWVIMSAGIMEFQGKPSVIGTLFEITERKNLESKLRYMQKMEAIGKLAGGVAHDFNNILGTIVGHASLLQMDLPQGPLQNRVGQIIAATERAAGLTQRLLTYGARRESSLKPCDLGALVAQQEAFFAGTLPSPVCLSIDPPTSTVPVLADSAQIERVLMNLVVNARDAMPDGGTIEVRAGVEEIDSAFMKLHGFGKPGPYACVSVKDSGTGMDESTRLRIFEPFFSTKGTGKGTGFGLSIVYDIVKDHSGFITVASEVGKGSLFKVYLPLTGSALPQKASAAPAVLRTSDATLLLAEDDEAARKSARAVFEDTGYTVLEAADGEEAVKMFHEHQGSIQLVITDIIMPKLSGRDVYNAIRSIKGDTRFLFSSGYGEDLLLKTGLLSPGQHFIAKPASRAELLAKVQDILD